jgi:hypothetical protein
MKKLLLLFFFKITTLPAQVQWHLVDSVNANLPASMQLYYTNDSLDGKPNKAYYIKAKLNDKHLLFDVDTTLGRRLTPSQYYEKNGKPLLVVNGTFFNFDKNQNLNVVVKNGKVLSHNIKTVQRKVNNKNETYAINRSAIGINKKRIPDIAWLATDSSSNTILARQAMDSTCNAIIATDVQPRVLRKMNKKYTKEWQRRNNLHRWKMQTAIGGGPVLVQQGQPQIYNEQEKLFDGKTGQIDKHPRTAMGYTFDGYLIIMVIEGRYPGIAEGASLQQEAKLLAKIGCLEALNLDGGGSSCMLINGKETIKPSEKGQQRPTPAVFIIKAQ